MLSQFWVPASTTNALRRETSCRAREASGRVRLAKTNRAERACDSPAIHKRHDILCHPLRSATHPESRRNGGISSVRVETSPQTRCRTGTKTALDSGAGRPPRLPSHVSALPWKRGRFAHGICVSSCATHSLPQRWCPCVLPSTGCPRVSAEMSCWAERMLGNLCDAPRAFCELEGYKGWLEDG